MWLNGNELLAKQETWIRYLGWEGGQLTPIFLSGKSHGRAAWWAMVHGVTESQMTEATEYAPMQSGNSS